MKKYYLLLLLLFFGKQSLAQVPIAWPEIGKFIKKHQTKGPKLSKKQVLYQANERVANGKRIPLTIYFDTINIDNENELVRRQLGEFDRNINGIRLNYFLVDSLFRSKVESAGCSIHIRAMDALDMDNLQMPATLEHEKAHEEFFRMLKKSSHNFIPRETIKAILMDEIRARFIERLHIIDAHISARFSRTVYFYYIDQIMETCEGLENQDVDSSEIFPKSLDLISYLKKVDVKYPLSARDYFVIFADVINSMRENVYSTYIPKSIKYAQEFAGIPEKYNNKEYLEFINKIWTINDVNIMKAAGEDTMRRLFAQLDQWMDSAEIQSFLKQPGIEKER
ncbi:MAG: hypothetical protein LBK26_02050 [Rickettsiales bacterium]|jgi:hypothetical protein|nr:hypothetical protein [Rickettsiales bacterium]